MAVAVAMTAMDSPATLTVDLTGTETTLCLRPGPEAAIPTGIPAAARKLDKDAGTFCTGILHKFFYMGSKIWKDCI